MFSFQHLSRIIILFGCLVSAFSPRLRAESSASHPSWWSDSITGIGVTASSGPGIDDNFAPINIGQLKHVASQAANHFELKFNYYGGKGSEITALIDSFANTNDNYAPVNIGQLKTVVKPFYKRLKSLNYPVKEMLMTVGIPEDKISQEEGFFLPWDNSIHTTQENWEVANIGQLKLVFSFDLDRDNWHYNLWKSGQTLEDNPQVFFEEQVAYQLTNYPIYNVPKYGNKITAGQSYSLPLRVKMIGETSISSLALYDDGVFIGNARSSFGVPKILQTINGPVVVSVEYRFYLNWHTSTSIPSGTHLITALAISDNGKEGWSSLAVRFAPTSSNDVTYGPIEGGIYGSIGKEGQQTQVKCVPFWNSPIFTAPISTAVSRYVTTYNPNTFNSIQKKHFNLKFSQNPQWAASSLVKSHSVYVLSGRGNGHICEITTNFSNELEIVCPQNDLLLESGDRIEIRPNWHINQAIPQDSIYPGLNATELYIQSSSEYGYSGPRRNDIESWIYEHNFGWKLKTDASDYILEAMGVSKSPYMGLASTFLVRTPVGLISKSWITLGDIVPGPISFPMDSLFSSVGYFQTKSVNLLETGLASQGIVQDINQQAINQQNNVPPQNPNASYRDRVGIVNRLDESSNWYFANSSWRNGNSPQPDFNRVVTFGSVIQVDRFDHARKTWIQAGDFIR
jgi:hypothetical protein